MLTVDSEFQRVTAPRSIINSEINPVKPSVVSESLLPPNV